MCIYCKPLPFQTVIQNIYSTSKRCVVVNYAQYKYSRGRHIREGCPQASDQHLNMQCDYVCYSTYAHTHMTLT